MTNAAFSAPPDIAAADISSCRLMRALEALAAQRGGGFRVIRLGSTGGSRG